MAYLIECDVCGSRTQDIAYHQCDSCDIVICDSCADRAGTKKGVQGYQDGEGFWARAGKVLGTIIKRACPRCLGDVRMIKAPKR